MTVVLLVCFIILLAFLANMRKRLAALEQRLDEMESHTGSEATSPAPRVAVAQVRTTPTVSASVARPPAAATVSAAPPPPPPTTPAEPVPSPWQRQTARAVAAEDKRDVEEGPATADAQADGYDVDQSPLARPGTAARMAINFEDLFGRQLPIWAGGVTLFIAAIFLVRLAIDAGFLSPSVRVVLGLLFGATLVSAAEWAQRRADQVKDPRIAQALSGAGLGAVYAATLAAANLYGLIGPLLAFAALTATTIAAACLALRFGAPSAVLGLVGGLAAPALIQSGQAGTPLLAAYIALLVTGLSLLSRRQRWMWLGIAILAGGSLWSLILLITSTLDQLSILAVGLLVLTIGMGAPMIVAGLFEQSRQSLLFRLVSATIAALQLAALVALGGFAPLSWALYALLSLAFLWLCRSHDAMRGSLLIPLITALGLLYLWQDPAARIFAPVVIGIILIYGGHALWRLRQAEATLIASIDALSLGLIALAVHYAVNFQFATIAFGDGLLPLMLGLLPAAGAAIIWRTAHQPEGRPFALAAYAAATMLAIALLDATPGWQAPALLAAVALVTLLVAQRAENRWLRYGAISYQLAAMSALAVTGRAGDEFDRLITSVSQEAPGQALLRWGAVFGVGVLFWHALRRGPVAAPLLGSTQIVVTLLGYGLLAQMVPAAWLGLSLSLAACLLLRRVNSASTNSLVPSALTAAWLAGLWAIAPAIKWSVAGLLSLFGLPVMVDALPTVDDALRQLLGPGLLLGFAFTYARAQVGDRVTRIAIGLSVAISIMGGHSLFKQFFAISTPEAFASFGLIERSVWEVLLLSGGLLALKLRQANKAAIMLIGAALGHAVLYSLCLHNPLLVDQALGGWPVLNLVLLSFGVMFAAVWWLPRIAPLDRPLARRIAAIARMILIVLFMLTTLRQMFGGSLPAAVPVGSGEDIAWSIGAVLLAVGYLVWGIRSANRDWRLASLVLMLGAVGKVFLFDASGLEGIARISSFLALGFSLIGIGWLYSRFLRSDASPHSPVPA